MLRKTEPIGDSKLDGRRIHVICPAKNTPSVTDFDEKCARAGKKPDCKHENYVLQTQYKGVEHVFSQHSLNWTVCRVRVQQSVRSLVVFALCDSATFHSVTLETTTPWACMWRSVLPRLFYMVTRHICGKASFATEHRLTVGGTWSKHKKS